MELDRFPRGKRIAVITGYDDGYAFDRRIAEAFNAWGLKGAFNLNSGKRQSTGKPAVEAGNRTHLAASELAELSRGHEVAIHSVTHPLLDRLDTSQMTPEVLADLTAPEDIVGYPVCGMAYPFVTYNAQVIETLRGLGIF